MFWIAIAFMAGMACSCLLLFLLALWLCRGYDKANNGPSYWR